MENLGWLAGVGFVGLGLFSYVAVFRFRTGRLDFFVTKLYEGADGRASFSKFQFLVWTVVILVGIVTIAVARMIATGDIVSPVDEIPENLLALLGLSTATSLGAKGVTTLYARQGLIQKGSKDPNDPQPPSQELLADDDGIPELAKIQLFLFTLLAVIFFLIAVGQAINQSDQAAIVLPDVDQALLVLMGVSSAGYIGKKFVTRDGTTRAAPTLDAIMPSEVPAGSDTQIMLTGTAFGDGSDGVLGVGPLLVKPSAWSNIDISFKLPTDDLLPAREKPYEVAVIVGGLKSPKQLLLVV